MARDASRPAHSKVPLHRRKLFRLALPARELILGRRTLIMGILNVTPDSFSDRGTFFDRCAAIARGLEIERQGADLLDIGGESTRPGAQPVEEQEEMDRTIPVIEVLRRKGLRIPISIDTYKAGVAERALAAGAEMVNDISGLRYDRGLAAVAARHRAGLVLMHVRGTPRTMQQLPPVGNIIPAIRRGLSVSVRWALRAGVRKQQIVLDPGIGFGKSRKQNFEIFRELSRLSSLGYPLLVGPSRKSFLQRTLSDTSSQAAAGRERPCDSIWARPASPLHHHKRKGRERVPEELLFGTAAAVAAAVLNGAHIVRVHDVPEMAAVARIADEMRGLEALP